MMNKKEVIENIKNLEGITILDKTINFDSEMIPKKEVLNIVNQIDEPVKPPEPEPWAPEKPVVPQFVADMIIKRKTAGQSVIKAIENLRFYEDACKWVRNNGDTFAKAWLYGYEVEKEKLYTARLKLISRKDSSYINKNKATKTLFIDDSLFDEDFKVHFTQAELEEIEVWNNPAFEIEEVTE